MLITQRDDGKQYEEERLFILQLITNTNLLSYCSDIIKPELASNKYSQRILEWIMEYYNDVGKAPMQDITSIFLANKNQMEEDEAKNIELLLGNLDRDDYLINNVQHNAQNIIDYFNWRKLEVLQQDMTNAIKLKDNKRAFELLSKFNRLEKIQKDRYNPKRDNNQTKEAFNFNEERLFRMPGALGLVIGYFLRGDIVGILAAQKAGKSWFALKVANEATNLGLKVVYFNLEITKTQMTRRIWQMSNYKAREPGTFIMPHFDEDEIVLEEFEVREKDLHLDEDDIEKDAKVMYRQTQGDLECFTYPRMSATLSNLKDDISDLEKEGFVADLIIVDNPDRMKYGGGKNVLHDEEMNWAKLTGWAQELNACIVAPMHGNREAYGGKNFGIKALGGSYGKLKDLGKVIQLSMTKEQKEGGYACVKLFEDINRDGDDCGGEAIALHCLDLGQWGFDSRFKNQVHLDFMDK